MEQSRRVEILGISEKILDSRLHSGKIECTVDSVRINNLNLQIIGSLGLEADTCNETVRIAAIHDERFRLADLITHIFPLKELQEACCCEVWTSCESNNHTLASLFAR
jgi:5-exo-hydroxycamphor dehydrogenase